MLVLISQFMGTTRISLLAYKEEEVGLRALGGLEVRPEKTPPGVHYTVITTDHGEVMLSGLRHPDAILGDWAGFLRQHPELEGKKPPPEQDWMVYVDNARMLVDAVPDPGFIDGDFVGGAIGSNWSMTAREIAEGTVRDLVRRGWGRGHWDNPRF